jgi:hypothetical protein
MNTKKFHYVYRITNTKLNKHYYGARTSSVEPSKDLGVNYFSSAFDHEFIKDQKNNPQDYKYVIVSEFNSRKEALELEIKLHAKFDVGVNKSFYNRTKQTNIGWDNTGTRQTEAAKLKMKEAAAKIKNSKEYSELKSKASKDRIHYYNPITKEKRMLLLNDIIPEGFVKGRYNKGIPRKKIKCPYCEMIGAENTMPRWHFDNCKKKPL